MKPQMSLRAFLVGSLCSFSLHSYGEELFWYHQPLSKPNSYSNLNLTLNQAFQVNANRQELSQTLLNREQSAFTLDLPMPDGTFKKFLLTNSPVYAPSLNEKYPNFRTFEGVQLDEPSNRGRFDITPQGFHGMFWYGGERAFIDPKWDSQQDEHFSYFKQNAVMEGAKNTFLQRSPIELENRVAANSASLSINGVKTYRLAIAAAGEYTAFHGGTKGTALAAIVTAVNRLNEIYLNELGVKFELVANNDQVIFDNASTDPFANTDADIDSNRAVMDNTIGNANYDVGHVFNTGGGGLAYLGVICNDSAKWAGMTGSSSPIADPFVIDYVAHELGHQFGAEHTFNGTTDACSNRASDSAFEPGSGSTIMAYAGICAEENLQRNSDAFFHSHSLEQMNTYLNQSGQCAKVDNTSNQAPVVNAGKDYAIPANTPFKLTGSATDPENNTLSYSWEQIDLGTPSSSQATMVDDGSRPIFRTWLPTSQPTRYLPRLNDVLLNKLTIGESYPTTNRNLNFKLVARDGQGNVAFDTVKITSVVTSEPFSVVAPAAGTVWAGNDNPTITWKVAGTTNAPISCANVDILLAQDGTDFAQVLLSNTPNDGSETISVPGVQTSTARLMIRCSDNIFFAVNSGTFTVSGQVNNVAPTILGQKTLSVTEDTPLVVALSDLTVQDPDSNFPNGFSLNLSAGSNYSVLANKVTPQLNFNGVLNVPVTVNDGKFDSQPFTLHISVTPVNDAPTVISSNTITATEDETFSLSLNQFTITDVDSESSSFSLIVLSGENYSVVGTNVTPSLNFNGELLVNVKVSDGLTESDTYKAKVDVTAVNDVPSIVGQTSISALEDTEFVIELTQLTVVDPDSTQFELNILAGSNYSVSNGKIQPTANYNGNLSVNVSLSDGSLTSAVTPVLVQISAVNDAPTATNDSLSTSEGASASSINVLANDFDVDGDNLSLVSVNYSGTGTVTITDGGISYTPGSGFSGSETFTYLISDGNGGEASASVSVSVVAKSQPPSPSNGSGGGGGSIYWLLGALLLLVFQRRAGQVQ